MLFAQGYLIWLLLVPFLFMFILRSYQDNLPGKKKKNFTHINLIVKLGFTSGLFVLKVILTQNHFCVFK
jgi:cytochrome b561